MTVATVCKDCGAEIPAELDSCPECFPEHKNTEAVPALLMLLLVCSSLLMVSTSYVNTKSGPVATPRKLSPDLDLQSAAYNAAKDIIVQRYPGEKTFSDLTQTPISRKDDHFVVMLTVTEFAKGQATRNFYRIEMDYSGGDWKLTGIQH